MKIHSNCESQTTKNVTALTIKTDKPLGFHIIITKKNLWIEITLYHPATKSSNFESSQSLYRTSKFKPQF